MKLGPKLRIPNIATETQGVIGKRGMGKSTYGVICVEELLLQKSQVIVLDPTGGWWGLRADSGSKGDAEFVGFPIPIFGGLHADLPLEETGGSVLADYVVENRLSCVLDLSLFSKGAMRRFVRDFAERFYLLKNQRRDPCHVVIDECDLFVPQRVDSPDMLPLVGAINDLVLRGRLRGIGVTLISQRPARINKDVLTQIEILVAFRLTGPQDIHAYAEWIEHNGTKEDQKRVLSSLSKLERGTGWFWAPGLMDGMLECVAFRDRTTFDSSRTPDGRKVKAPGTLADVDLGKLSDAMKATVEKVKERDPHALRRRIAELEREVTAAEAAADAARKLNPPTTKVERVEIPLMTKAEWDELDRAHHALAALREDLNQLRGSMEDRADKISKWIDVIRERVTFWRNIDQSPRVVGNAWTKPGPRRVKLRHEPVTVPTTFARLEDLETPTLVATMEKDKAGSWRTTIHGERDAPAGVKLGKGERRTLIAIAQHQAEGVTRPQLTQLTGYTRRTRDSYLQKLGQAAFVAPDHGAIIATKAGLDWLGCDYEPLPVGDALLKHWLSNLPEGECNVLMVATKAFPNAIDRSKIDTLTGYTRRTRDSYLQKLKARRLVDDAGRGSIIAASALFD